MAPATRTIASTSHNEDADIGARLRSVEEYLAQVTRALQEMNHGLNGNGRIQNQNQFTRMTKVDFPKFLGDYVKGWIFRCEQLFSINDIPKNQKVKFISVNLFDTALLWHRQFIRLNGEAVSWNVYKKGILQRFGTVFNDPVSEIRKIKYHSSAKDYQDTFVTLLSRVDVKQFIRLNGEAVSWNAYKKGILQRFGTVFNDPFIRLNGEAVSWNVYKKGILQRFGTVFDDPVSEIRKIKYQSNAKDYQDDFDTLLSRVDVSEEHAVRFYLGGLPTEIEMGVRMFRPTTLDDAYQLTTLQEATLEAIKKKNKAVVNSQQGRFGGGGNGYRSNFKPSLLPLPSSNSNWRNKPNTSATTPIRKQMTQKEYQGKRA
nr:hypothetical protein [Tanacetum cinerariifolium]